MTESIGERLRRAREARKLSLDQVAQATRIRVHYLKALEDNDLERMPSTVQARGFIRSYANYLNLDLDSPEVAVAVRSEPIPTDQEQPTTVKSALPQAEQAQAIFEEVGMRLRRQREILGLSQEDIERHTHLRIRYLKALESGKINDLPSPVQGRGMLSNYANFLGMDPELLLLRFAEGLQTSLAARQAARASTQPTKTRPVPSRFPFLRNLLSLDLLVGGLLVVFIVGFVIWGAFRISILQSGIQPTVTAPSIAEILTMSTVTPTPSLTVTVVEIPLDNVPTQELLESTPDLTNVPLDATLAPPAEFLVPTETATFPPFPLSAVQVYIVVRQRAWMRVSVDGVEEFSGRVAPGSAYLFSGKEQVEILTGNGAALNVYFNQVDLGTLGILGEVVYRVYTPAGVVEPTPTLTLTSTQTTTPLVTPTPTIPPTSTLAP